MSGEYLIENTVTNKAITAGWFCRKLKWVGRVGAPDRLFIKGSRVVFIEFKAAGERPKGFQATEHDRMRAAGAEVHVVDKVADGLRILGVRE